MRDQQIAEYPETASRTGPEPPVASQKREPPKPRRGKPALIAAGFILLLVILFFVGYLPRRHREQALQAGLKKEKSTLPEVNVAETVKAPAKGDLLLPGNMTPLTEAVINARAEGYLRKRYVDIGDRVKAGQLLAEIEAPELDQQVQQGRASLSQTKAALGRTQHALVQSQANAHLSEVTVQRWKTLADRGVVSKQEYDQKQGQFESDQAAVQSAQSDVTAAQDNIRASEANLQRLIELQGYEKITAPFAGVVTVRNVDVGALISTTGSTPLFRIARIDILRLMIDVPEQSAPYIRVGEPAEIRLQEFGSRKFIGHVSRTANSLDANSRTLPVEVQVLNSDYALLPNMFAQVNLVGASAAATALVPGDALIVKPEGTQVAVVGKDNRVHFRAVEVGRDYGPQIEIRSGLNGGERVVVNPSDDVREGAEINPILQKQKAVLQTGGSPAGAQPTSAGKGKGK